MKYSPGTRQIAIISMVSMPFLFYSAFGFSLSIGTIPPVIFLIYKALNFRNINIYKIVLISKVSLTSLGIILFLLLHASFSYTKYNFDTGKFFGSLLLISLILWAASFKIEKKFIPNLISLENLITFLVTSFIGISIIGFFSSGMLPYTSIKSVFIFSEPSYFTLALAPFLITSVALKQRFSWLYILYFALWGIYVQNITIIFLVLMAFLINIKIDKKSLISMSIILSLFFLYILSDEYFSNRLNFDIENDNLSVLVFMQGWQNSLIALQNSSYWGVGFQQFGILSDRGDISARLSGLGFSELNIYDGGTNGSKIIGEFGIFGIILLLCYVYVFCKSFMYIRSFDKKSKPHLNALYFSCIISYFPEIFVRGVGYFAPSLYLVTMALYSGAIPLTFKRN
jgi:hypothetical protein